MTWRERPSITMKPNWWRMLACLLLHPLLHRGEGGHRGDRLP